MNQRASLANLVNYHLRLHGGMELIDIYKLAYQSVFGPEHLFHAPMTHDILREMQTPGVTFAEPLLEPISPSDNACRVNLRTARRQGITHQIVEEAVRNSARQFSRSQNTLCRLWSEIGNSLESLEKRFNAEDFSRLTQFLQANGFAPLHHSSAYRRMNRPAYRVLMKDELERLMPPSPADSRLP
ncbi:MAG: hypothetical protein C4532_11305 [Candidatus Abyssobacteria bacterium SURF_17]|uniref:Uncharacterized protein n=1 Tax=Candidatus Abyssobacteria bacterium SURF_17 TaxID=2093361 RepID=A0A419EWY4_9BACT|nr:MAG: hypothetical protein C4532_11305 [Candidatus Abyssubacteria bacterium SURF_17]